MDAVKTASMMDQDCRTVPVMLVILKSGLIVSQSIIVMPIMAGALNFVTMNLPEYLVVRVAADIHPTTRIVNWHLVCSRFSNRCTQ